MRSTGLISFLAGIVPVLVTRLKGDQAKAAQASDNAESTSQKIEGYAAIGGTDAEIADRFGLDAASLRADFETVLRSSRALGKLSLRRAQWDLAMKGNGPMLTWLGRNMLGQSLNPQTPGEREPEMEEKPG